MNMESTESFTFNDPVTGCKILQLTNASRRSVHGYYDIPPWSPKSGRVVFTRMDAPNAAEGDICMVDRAGGSVEVLAHSHANHVWRAISANGGALPQWSADGQRVYYKDRNGDQRLIAWVNVETGSRGSYAGDLRMLSPTNLLNVYHTNCGDFPDHVIPHRRAEHGIFVQDLETGASQRIVTVQDCWAIHPRQDEIADWHLYIKHTKWSPDGTRLMFVFTNEIRYAPKYGELPRVKDVYVINADGSGLKRVGEFGHHPLWHPNGRDILANIPFEGRPTRNSLVLLDTETGEKRLAATCIAGNGHPSFSPDGTKIVLDFVKGNEGYGSLCLVDVESDTVEELARDSVTNHSHTGTHLHPVWSQDSRQILYACDASGTAQLRVITV